MTMREKFERLIFQNVIHYPNYTTCERMSSGGVVTFHKVGHNSSHEFWLGMLPNDRMVCMSVGEGFEVGVLEEHIEVYPVGESPSYIGHW